MSRIRSLTTGMIFAYVVCMIMPEEWTEKCHIGEVPLACLILTGICCLLYVQFLGTPSAVSPGLLGGLVVLALTGTYGYIRGNIDAYSLKFFVADMYFFAAFLVGLAYGGTKNEEELKVIVKRMAWVATIGIVVTYAALFIGLTGTTLVLPAGRQVTMSIFMASGYLIILLPWASVASSGAYRNWGGIQVLILLATSAATALLSGTRSMFLLLLGVIVLCFILKPKRQRRQFSFLLLGGSLLAALLLASGLPIFETVLFERIATGGIVEEKRSVEVSMFWSQLRDDIVIGQGMGSRFVSDVVVDGDPLASAPHVGILTFLMKGGVLVFVAYALVPTFSALVVLLSPKSMSVRRGAAGSMLVFVASACMSGGWSPLALFAYGLATSAVASEMRRRIAVQFSSASEHITAPI